MVRELKHTEIGDIPVDWELQTFDETFRVISNNTLSRENLNNRGGAVRNIHYGDILTKFPEVLDCSDDEIPFVNDLSLLSSSTQLLQDGDVVIADTAEDETVGKVTEVQNLGDSKLVAGLHTILCRVKKGDFAPGWLGYYMNSDLFHNQILPYITGIKVSSISKGAISETLILVPPFDEQEKIVQSLNKIQLLMTAETNVVNKIKLVKNGCLSKMFPQKDDTVPEMRLPGFTEAWEQRKLSDIAVLTSSKRVHAEDYVEAGVPFYRGKEISELKEHKPISEVLYITEYKYNEISSMYGSPKEGDLLITAVGTLGNTWVIDQTPFYFKDGNLIWFKDIKCNPKYLDYAMSTADGQKKILASAIGSNQKALTMVKLNELEFMFPGKAEQDKIAEYFSYLDNLITLHQCKCDKYSNIKKGMMSDLLTGKIRLV